MQSCFKCFHVVGIIELVEIGWNLVGIWLKSHEECEKRESFNSITTTCQY